MENPVIRRGRANVAQYENGDVDVRWPEENENLKQEKLSETKAGTLSRTQGETPLLQLRVKTRADAADPAADLQEECARLLGKYFPKSKYLTKISTKSKGRWLCRREDVQIRADTEHGNVEIHLVLPLMEAYDLQQRLTTNKFPEVFSCLATQKTTLSRLVNALKKSSEN